MNTPDFLRFPKRPSLFITGLMLAVLFGSQSFAASVKEKETVVEGVLYISHTDNFETGTSEFLYTLQSKDGRRISVYFPFPEKVPASGSLVRLKGFLLDTSLAVYPTKDAVTIVRQPLKSSLSAKNTQAKKVAVILFNFQNYTIQPFTSEDARRAIFTDADSPNKYFKEISFNLHPGFMGNIRPDGDVFGWYTIPYSASPSCYLYPWADAARAQFEAAGNSFNGYEKVVYAFPRTAACSFDGAATIGAQNGIEYVWLNGALNKKTLAHEFGHNEGAWHANSYSCVDENNNPVTLSNNCQSREYGDPFDAMGGAYLKHFNAHNKAGVNFLTSSQTLTLAPPGGTVSLLPIEQGSGVKRLLIPRDRNPDGNISASYELEYRQPFGFDNFASSDPVVNGVSMRLDTTQLYSANNSFLLDATPSTLTTIDAPLMRGSTYVDTTRGIIIAVPSADSTQATVEVQYGPCVRRNPTVRILAQSGGQAMPGDTRTYIVEFINNDGFNCPAAEFDIVPELPNNAWVYAFDGVPPFRTFFPGSKQTVMLQITSPLDATNQTYTIPVKLKNAAFPNYIGEASITYEVYVACSRGVPEITAVNPTVITLPGAQAAYTFKVKNNDAPSCPHALFSLAAALPSGWTQFPATAYVQLRPGTFAHVTVYITSPSSIAGGIYTWPVTVRNTHAPDQSAQTSIQYSIVQQRPQR